MAFTKDMINCTVEENRMGHLTVTFENGKSIYLQEEQRRAEFGVSCGLVKAPDNWDGQSSNLPDSWWEKDFESITKCPSYYILSAE